MRRSSNRSEFTNHLRKDFKKREDIPALGFQSGTKERQNSERNSVFFFRRPNTKAPRKGVASRSVISAEDRHFTIESGVSLYLMSEDALTPDEERTIRTSHTPAVIMTAEGINDRRSDCLRSGLGHLCRSCVLGQVRSPSSANRSVASTAECSGFKILTSGATRCTNLMENRFQVPSHLRLLIGDNHRRRTIRRCPQPRNVGVSEKEEVVQPALVIAECAYTKDPTCDVCKIENIVRTQYRRQN